MKITHNQLTINLTAFLRDTKKTIPIQVRTIDQETLEYSITYSSKTKTSIVIEISCENNDDIFHLIPCNIHGDNNLEKAKPGYFPNLTTTHKNHITSSPIWEFRADRASHPVSIIATSNDAIGISVNPYMNDGKLIKNGLYSKLPASAGVTLGYQNIPVTFTSKENMTPSTKDTCNNFNSIGHIYFIKGENRLSCHKIIKKVYATYHEQPTYSHNHKTYLKAFLKSYKQINWSEKEQAFTNMDCHLPSNPVLSPWRPLIATGWTGTGVLCYPLLLSQLLLNENNSFTNKLTNLFDKMSNRINPNSGLFYDLIKTHKGSDVNGWWAGYIVKDCHCAYTNGHGIYYLLKTYQLLKAKQDIVKKEWLSSSLIALNTIIGLQKNDGNFGYTYSLNEAKILDDEGFAGCWFVPALLLAYQITNQSKYLASAKKGMIFYHAFVTNLTCFGTPMDTWKSIDEEGNLAFIRGARLLHEITKEEKYLTMLEDGANYEYLWRYCFKAKPEFPPLKDSAWNSCGGSITSVSNPHIHPMGVNITADLFYLYQMTNNPYHLSRAQDGLYWGLQTADLYPKVTGYGQLGVMTERYCPSDGLTIEEYDNHSKSSIWFTFNGWAGVSVLEGLSESILQKYIKL